MDRFVCFRSDIVAVVVFGGCCSTSAVVIDTGLGSRPETLNLATWSPSIASNRSLIDFVYDGNEFAIYVEIANYDNLKAT